MNFNLNLGRIKNPRIWYYTEKLYTNTIDEREWNFVQTSILE